MTFKDITQYGVTASVDQEYNKAYKSVGGEFQENPNVETTGKGNNAYIYRNHKEAAEFRTSDLAKDGVGDFYGATLSRNGSIDGDATESSKFVYNGGTTSNSNRPTYFDKNSPDYADNARAERPYNIGGNYNVNAFRNKADN